MTAPRYTYTDHDGDNLRVRPGTIGIVVTTEDGDTRELVQVAVSTAELPHLIASLQELQEWLS